MSLFDYELIVGDDGKRLLAFGKFAGRAGLIDFLHGLGQRKNLETPPQMDIYFSSIFPSEHIYSFIYLFFQNMLKVVSMICRLRKLA